MRAPSTCVKFSQGMLSQHELLSRRGIGWLGGDFSLVLKSFWFLCHVIVSLFQRLNANLRKNSLLCSTQWKLLSQNISFQILFSVHTHTHFIYFYNTEIMLVLWKKSYDQSRQHIKKQRQYFADKGSSSHSYGFSSNHIWMWELDHKESRVPKNWCFWTVVLEKTLKESLGLQGDQTSQS